MISGVVVSGAEVVDDVTHQVGYPSSRFGSTTATVGYVSLVDVESISAQPALPPALFPMFIDIIVRVPPVTFFALCGEPVVLIPPSFRWEWGCVYQFTGALKELFYLG